MEGRKQIAVFATVCLVLCILFAIPNVVKAYVPANPLPSLTGNQLEDIVHVAESQIGYTETDGGTVYGAEFKNEYGEWCAYFISWCARKANIDKSVIPSTGSVDDFLYYGTKHIAADGYIPKRGDIVVYGDSTAQYHVGLVTGYNSKYKYATTVEGNLSEKVKASRTTWFKNGRGISISPAYYITPNYNSVAPAKPAI